MVHFKVFGTLLLLFLTQFVLGQKFQRYGFNEGLESEIIVDISQDSKGYLWIATLGGGISRFDGEVFKNFTVRNGLSHNFVMELFCLGDSLYATTDNGISISSMGDRFKNISSGQIKSAAMAESGALYFRNQEGTLMVYRDGNILIKEVVHEGNPERVSFLKQLGNLVYILSDSRNLFTADESGAITWIHDFNRDHVYTSGGVSLIIGQGPDYSPNILVEPTTNLSDVLKRGASPRQIFSEHPFRHWVIQSRKLFLTEGSQVTNLSTDLTFTKQEVNVVFKDREQTIWVGTYDGLFKFEEVEYKSSVSLPEEEEFLSTTVYKNGILSGTATGEIYEIAGGEFHLSSFSKLVQGHRLVSMFYDSLTTTLWVGSNRGLLAIRENTLEVTSYLKEVPAESIRMIRRFGDQLLVGTEKGLFLRDQDGIFKHVDLESSKKDAIIWGVAQERTGRIVVLTRDGIYYLGPQGRVAKDTISQETSKKRVTCMAIDDLDNLWIGTVGYGLLHLNQQTRALETITTDDGLSSDLIMNVIWDKTGSVFVGTNRGIDMLPVHDSSKNIRRIRKLNKQTLPTNFNTFRLDASGSVLWLGSGSQIIPIRWKSSMDKALPVLHFRSVEIIRSGDRIALGVTDSLAQEPLSYDENSIDFEFKAVSLTDPKSVTYSHRLLGWDTSWVSGKANSVSYTNLPPGGYTFQVQASNGYHQAGSNVLSYSFTIMKPFWVRTWFILLGIIFITSSTVIIYRVRLRTKIRKIFLLEKAKQEEIEKVRKEIARDFHDSMGNNLAGIKLYSNLALLRSSDLSKDVQEILTFIELKAQELFEGTKDFIWSIDPESDNLVELYTYIKDFGEEFFKKSEISFYSELSTSGINPKLQSGQSRHLVMIFREAMTNTIKHAEASVVKMNLEITASGFIFTYHDNGVGIQGMNAHGKGINNMHTRAGHIDAHLTITARTPGTQIKLEGNYSNP